MPGHILASATTDNLGIQAAAAVAEMAVVSSNSRSNSSSRAKGILKALEFLAFVSAKAYKGAGQIAWSAIVREWARFRATNDHGACDPGLDRFDRYVRRDFAPGN